MKYSLKVFHPMQRERTTMETLFNAVYADKKLSKAQLRSIDINLIIESSNVDKLNLKRLSIVLVALSKILQKRMKILLEDASHFYQLLNHCPAKRAPRAPSSKNITLNIENNRLFINDEMIDFGEELIMEALENSILDQSYMNQAFDVDFADGMSIEQVRESTLMSNEMNSNIFNDTTLSINIKRRKIIEDSAIEISENIFKSNLRSVHDILMKPKASNLDISGSLIKIDKKMDQFLNSLKPILLPVEEQRHQDFDADFAAPDISFNPIEGSNNMSSIFKSDRAGNEFLLFEDLSSFPKNFIFNLLIQQISKEEKAINFLALLNLATEGRISPTQSHAFGAIECNLNE